MDERTTLNELLAENDRLRGQVRELEQALHDALSATERLRMLVYRDSLTGLPNRRSLDDCFRNILSARRLNRHIALLFLDVDDFKQVNDSIGHRAGDELLRQLATSLGTLLQSHDLSYNDVCNMAHGEIGTRSLLSRIGGDEFVITIPTLDDPAIAADVADAIIRSLSIPFTANGREVVITASIGIAIYPFDGETMDALIQSADAAMYKAKRNGKARYEYHCTPSALRIRT